MKQCYGETGVNKIVLLVCLRVEFRFGNLEKFPNFFAPHIGSPHLDFDPNSDPEIVIAQTRPIVPP